MDRSAHLPPQARQPLWHTNKRARSLLSFSNHSKAAFNCGLVQALGCLLDHQRSSHHRVTDRLAAASVMVGGTGGRYWPLLKPSK
jgi:hypothetical protein